MLVAVLSDKPELREQFCRLIGTEGPKGDISFYNGEKISLVEPTKYPERIQPLLYSLSMADYAVLIVESLTPKIGEIIVALDSLKIESGLIISNVPLPLKGTVLDKYEKMSDMNAAKEKLRSIQAPAGEGSTLVLVDSVASVPSVGNVAHGIIKLGSIKKQEKLFVLPEKKEIDIRSIRAGGNEVEEAGAGACFEMAYRGDIFERGMLVPLRNDVQVENVVNGRFSKNAFFKDELKGRIHAYTNMQFVEGNLTDNDLTLSQPLAFEKGERILVIDASNQKLRVAGVFQSKW